MPALAKRRRHGHKYAMTDTSLFALSPAHAALAGICLVAALDGDDETLAAHIAACRQIDAAALAHIGPLVLETADAPDGVDAVLALIGDAVAAQHADTTYILCADYVALHGRALSAQLRLLERLGETLRIDRLTRAALDRAALARAQSLSDETLI